VITSKSALLPSARDHSRDVRHQGMSGPPGLVASDRYRDAAAPPGEVASAGRDAVLEYP
jgi:hypothetical protein